MEQPANNPANKENPSAQIGNSPLESELATQVAALETDVPKIDDSEVQAKIQQLIKLIRTTLKAQTLSPRTQKELARLISLLSSLNNSHAQQLNLLDLAVSILLEPSDANPAGSSASGRLKRKNSDPKNLTFVQETRRQVAHQSRVYPDVVRAIITGSGTPYIRLITGLTWFFFLFVLAPVTASGLVFATIRLFKVNEFQYLEADNTFLLKKLIEKDQQIEDLTSHNKSLVVSLERADRLLPKLPESGTEQQSTESTNSGALVTPQDNPANLETSPTRILVNVEEIASIQLEIEKGLEDAQQAAEIARTNTEADANAESSIAVTASEDAVSSNKKQKDRAGKAKKSGDGDAKLPEPKKEFVITHKLPIKTGPWPIVLAISIGALGGTVSVIVRANTFIRQAQETENDLFLTGFFRPFVGMSFAIFCVALVEAGIFSGIFDLSDRKDAADRTYFYIAIAFVAGFSERLVRDVVIKTEDTLAGPNPNPPNPQ